MIEQQDIDLKNNNHKLDRIIDSLDMLIHLK